LPGEFSQNEIDAILKGLANKKGKEGVGEDVFADQGGSLSLEKREAGPVVERVEFAQLKKRSAPGVNKRPDLNLFNNIPLVLSGELGKAVITVRDLLKLKEGSVIKLEKMVGESATLLLNDEYLGQAEIVVINDRFGLRITALGDGEEKETRPAKEVHIKEIREAEKQAASAQSASAAANENEEE
jgi:flagellar motor switch protein FliN/FliY